MARRRRERKVQLARNILLGLLAIFFGVISAVYWVGRDAGSGPFQAEETAGSAALSNLLSAGEGFEYEATEGDQRLFRIRAESVIQSKDSLFELEKAFIEVTRDDGSVYEIESDTALYRAEGREQLTELEGNAVVRSDSGAEMQSTGFKLQRRGRLVTSTGPVRFRLGTRLRGTANEMEAYLQKDRYQLAGNVRVFGGPDDPTFSLRCRRLIFEEKNRRIYAEGDVRLRRQGQEINAGRITVTLAEESDDVRFVRARFNVSGSQASDDDLGSRFSFEAADLSLDYDEVSGDLRRGELESRRDRTVWIESTDESQIARRVTAPRILLGFADDELRRVEAVGKVETREYLRFAPRTILLLTCSNSAVAEFSPARGLERLRLINRVDLHQDGVHAVGLSLERLARSDSTTLEGFPAAIYTPRGELQAPAVTFYGDGGRAEATGGVRASMTRSSGFSMIREESSEDAADDVPVTVTSEEASWDAESGSFSFSGEARAWQREDFIVGDTISGEDGGARLSAKGNVRTVMRSRRSSEAEATAEERAPIEVAAGEMDYRRQQGLLRYLGSPVSRQAGRTVRCEEMDLELDAADELERMVCRGSVSIDDPVGSRKISGDLAIYRPADSLLEVGGAPAVLTDTDGAEVRGRVLIYDLETGVANVRTGELVDEKREEPSP